MTSGFKLPSGATGLPGKPTLVATITEWERSRSHAPMISSDSPPLLPGAQAV
jgi:hypothetical protein